MSKKDINTLIKLYRKFGESICDKGTFEERRTKHIIHKWKYKGEEFRMTFPISPGGGQTINNCYAQVRRKLRAIGLEPPREFAMKLIGSVEQRKLLEEIWEHLGTDDEGETPYGGEIDK